MYKQAERELFFFVKKSKKKPSTLRAETDKMPALQLEGNKTLAILKAFF